MEVMFLSLGRMKAVIVMSLLAFSLLALSDAASVWDRFDYNFFKGLSGDNGNLVSKLEESAKLKGGCVTVTFG